MARKKGGLLFGIMMGAILGVLFAPGKGKRLREQLSREIRDGGLGAKTIRDNFKMMGRDIIDAGRGAYEDPRVQRGITRGGSTLRDTTLALLNNLLKTLKSWNKNDKSE